MRHWIFHPLIFYPLVLLIAGLAIFASLEPQNWPRKPAPVAGRHEGASLVWERGGFNSPDVGPEQRLTVERDLWGQAQGMRIAQVPNQPPPTPAEQGVRILFTPQDAALIDGKAVTAEITYAPLPFNSATSMALSVQGIGPAEWTTVAAPSPPEGPLKFELPPQLAPDGLGIRVLAGQTGAEAFGLEIIKVKLTPHG
ncbi:MAG: hypothetical protein QM759_15285 [Terricaulis sp.]